MIIFIDVSVILIDKWPTTYILLIFFRNSLGKYCFISIFGIDPDFVDYFGRSDSSRIFNIVYLFITRFQSTLLKKGWHLISSASPFPLPSLLSGFLCNNYWFMIHITALRRDLASSDILLGILSIPFSMLWKSCSLELA